VLKLRIALCLALIVGTLTLLNGMLQGARLETVIYRIIISIAIFGIIGYVLGIIVERFLQKKLEVKNRDQGQKEESVNEEQFLDDLPKDSEFAPFTSNSFQQITRPKE
jgi:Na+/glutamate symporter